MATTNKKNIAYISIGVGVVALSSWGIYVLIKKKKDNNAMDFYREAEKLLDPEYSAQTSKAFDTKYWKEVDSNTKMITQATAEALAKELDGYFVKALLLPTLIDIDEQKINAFYRRFDNQAQMSRVAYAYNIIYKTDLLNKLTADRGLSRLDIMDQEEFSKLMGIINEKPKK